MAELFATGRAVDVVLLVIALEALLLVGWRLLTGGGLALGQIALALLPGIMLLLALRAALLQSAWIWIAVFLVLSFPLHLIDLSRRMRERQPNTQLS
jgi:hypothetical protein